MNLILPDSIANPDDTFPLEVQVGKDWFDDVDSIDNRNQVNVIKIDMNQLNAFTEGDGSLEIGRGEDGTRVNSKTSAQTSIDTLDKALVQVNDYRAYLGSIQNRLNSTVNNLGVQVENLSAANSRIRRYRLCCRNSNIHTAKNTSKCWCICSFSSKPSSTSCNDTSSRYVISELAKSLTQMVFHLSFFTFKSFIFPELLLTHLAH